jgi:hypothetical protein
LRSNISALSINLSEEDIQEIESATPLDIGYRHNLLSGSSDKTASAKNPAFPVTMYGSFDGVV